MNVNQLERYLELRIALRCGNVIRYAASMRLHVYRCTSDIPVRCYGDNKKKLYTRTYHTVRPDECRLLLDIDGTPNTIHPLKPVTAQTAQCLVRPGCTPVRKLVQHLNAVSWAHGYT